MTRIVAWYRRQRILGYALFTLGMAYIGFGAATSHLISDVTPVTDAQTRTVTSVATTTRRVTIRVPGKVIRRVDHVLVVQTPRYIFIYHGRRHVLRPKIVRIRFTLPTPTEPPVIAAVLAEGAPATVTVPVTIPVPGPTTTVTGPTTTVTGPTTTVLTTITVPTTITLPVDSSTSP